MQQHFSAAEVRASRAALGKLADHLAGKIAECAQRFPKTIAWGPDLSRRFDEIGAALQANRDLAAYGPSSEQARIILYDLGKCGEAIKVSVVPKWVVISRSLRTMAAEGVGISQDVNQFRFILERIALLHEIDHRFREVGFLQMAAEPKWETIMQFAGDLEPYGLGTRVNWKALALNSFSELSRSDLDLVSEPGLRDRPRSPQILNAIDKYDRRSRKGARVFYEYLCEFVHPNIGDAVSSISKVTVRSDRYGFEYRRREYTGVPDDSIAYMAEIQIFKKAVDFFVDIMSDLVKISESLVLVLSEVEKSQRRAIHKLYKRQRHCLRKDDLCPCGSGRIIRSCAMGVSR